MRKWHVITVAFAFGAFALQPLDARADCLHGRAGRSTAQGAFLGGLLGAVIGAATGNNSNRGGRAAAGGAIGAILGGAAGCWTAHEQSIAAAEEDRLDTKIAEVEQHTADLHKYNAELRAEIGDLRREVADAEDSESSETDAVADARQQLRAEQDHARHQLATLTGALGNVSDMIRQLDPSDSDYRRRRDLLGTEQAELLTVRGNLQEILAIET